jgi:hypothetical protein
MKNNSNNRDAYAEEATQLKQKNAQLRNALERVRIEVLARYIPFDVQEQIREALEQ